MAAARLQYVNLPKVIEVIPIQKKTIRRICNPKSNPEIEISAPDYSFGPFYTESESATCKGAKEKAWTKIIEKERIEPKKILLEKIVKKIRKWKVEKLEEMREEVEKQVKIELAEKERELDIQGITEEIREKWRKKEEKEKREKKEKEREEWKKIIDEEITECKKRMEKEGTEWKKIIEKEDTETEGTEPKKTIGKTRSEWKKIVEENIIEIGRTKWKKQEIDEHTNQRYMAAMRRVEKEARAAYGGDAELADLTESEFRWKMIIDGCFFLQLALSLLNASVLLDLNYPDDDPIFGKKQSTKTFMGLIKSMFLVGNQIPLVVLSELMNQNYFRTVIDSVQGWERPSDMLSKQLLYDLLVDPLISNGKLWSWKNSQTLEKLRDLMRSMACWSIHAEKPTYDSSHHEKPSDLLHGLQLFLLGPADDQKAASLDDGGELLDEELEDRDLEAGIKLKSPNPKANNSKEEEQLLPLQVANFKKQLSEFNAIKEELEKNKQLSASNLAKKGIYIWNNSKGGGSRGIDFKNRILCGSLFMPPLKVNRETNVLFTNLKYYEIVHKQKEVRSYINFMANLVSTYEDLNVLASKKIIDENTKSEDKERFLEMLGNLSDKEEVLITHRHNSVIGRVKDYSVFPWYIFKYVAIFVFVLTILQTIFGILSFRVGVKQLHQQESGFNSTGRKFQFP